MNWPIFLIRQGLIMANISKAKRTRIEGSKLADLTITTGDELAYVILFLSCKMMATNGAHHDVIGGIEAAKAELFRKVINPSEVQREYNHGAISE
jgi:hypothetical protein